MTLGKVDHRHALTDDAEIVEVRLDAVVGAAADCDLKLVGQRYAVIAYIEALVQLLGKTVGVC